MANAESPDGTDETADEVDTEESRVLDAGALKALAHPLRIRIYDILNQFGPQTASSLAERLGESSGATSYHLRALAKHDLIREVEGRGTARERWWERPHGSVLMSSPDAVRTPSGRAASQIVVTEMYRQRHEQLMRFVEESMRTDDDTAAELSTATTRLTPAQFAEVAARLREIISDTVKSHREQQGDDVRTYLIRLDFFPLDMATRSPRGGER